MRIRQACLQDAPAMARVMVDTFMAAHRGQLPEEAWQKRKAEWTYTVSEGAWERTLRGIIDGTNPLECIYVAEVEAGELIGLAMGERIGTEAAGMIGEVHALYVRLNHQGQGVGRRLIQAVAAHMIPWRIRSLHVAVLKANTPARCFYEALGGQVVGERALDEEGILLSGVVYGWSDLEALLAR